MEIFIYLVCVKDADDLVGGDLGSLGVDLGATVVDVAGLAVHLPGRPLAAGHVHHLCR